MDLRVNISFTKDGFLQRATVRALDIGINGIAVSSPLPFGEGSPVELDITLPGSKVPIRAKAVIRNHKGLRYGVEFLSITDAQKDDITRYGTARKPAGSVESGLSGLPVLPAVN